MGIAEVSSSATKPQRRHDGTRFKHVYEDKKRREQEKTAEYKMRTSPLAKNAKSATELVNMRFSWPADSIC